MSKWWTLTCDQCGREYHQEDTGRTKLYCSNACKQKAYRQRRAWKRADENRRWLDEKPKQLDD